MSFKDGDVLFLNATIIDGSGITSSYRASALISGGFIASIYSTLSSEDAEKAKNAGVRIVDCNDGTYALSPGFIDM